MDEGPLDRWSTVEDIWTRLAQTFSVKVERDGDQVRLMFELMSAVPLLPDPGLLLAALDPQSYVWHQGSIKGSFITHLEIEDDDLVFWLTPQPLIERWPNGADLGWQIQCLLTSFQKARPWTCVA
jgi:hypothetical protein